MSQSENGAGSRGSNARKSLKNGFFCRFFSFENALGYQSDPLRGGGGLKVWTFRAPEPRQAHAQIFCSYLKTIKEFKGERTMARGGARPGAGRKKKTQTTEEWAGPRIADDSTLKPLDFWLAILRDPDAPYEMRAMAADKAGPYIHAKPAPRRDDQGDFGDMTSAGDDWSGVVPSAPMRN